MADENTVVANDNTNEPQPQTEQAAQSATATETMLGGAGSTEQQKEPEQQAEAKEPEAYDFSATLNGTEMDEAITKEFSELSRSMGLTNEQANQMAAYGIKYGQIAADAVKAQYEAEVTKWGADAKAEMGADFEKIMTTAGAGIEAAEKVIPGIRQALNETGAGNRIELIRAFEMLGQLVQADPGKLVNAGGAPTPTKSESWYPNSKM